MKKEISEQLYLVTNGPLDAKVSPVDNVSDLLAIPRAHRYRGMTVMVLNKDSEEELRCLYVALTRAETDLYISVPKYTMRNGQMERNRLSRFFDGSEKYFAEVM